MINYRWDEFLQLSLAQLISGEAITVPSSSPYYVPLREVPRQDTVSTVLVRNAASTSTVNPDQDCYVWQQNPGTNYDGSQLLVGKDASNNVYRSFIRFNIAALPTSPSAVKLRVYANRNVVGVGSTSVSVHQVTSTWTETGPTYTSQPTYNSTPASAMAWSETNPKGDGGGYQECDITSLYNAWKAGSNYGLLLKGDESLSNNWVIGQSRASSTQAPQLVVVSAGAYYTEVGSTVDPVAGEFACHYGTGRLRFHSSAAGASLLVDYRGTGSPVDAQDVPVWLGSTTGTNTYVATTGTFIRLVDGLLVTVKIGTGNTGASTLNINGTGGKAIQRFGSPVSSGQLVAGAVYVMVYDGTAFQMIGV